MANELKLTVKLDFSKSSVKAKLDAADGLLLNVTGTKVLHHVQNVGTVAESLVLGDVPVGGYFIAVNRSPDYNIKIGADTGENACVLLQPGEVCCFRFNDYENSPEVQAVTGAAELEYIILED